MRIRRPLRPLATVIAARERGQDPDRSIAEDRVLKARALRARENRRAEVRIILLSLVFVAGFGAIATRMATLATTSAPEVAARTTSTAPLRDDRADILDRDGRVLATNVRTRSLYAQPYLMVDRDAAAEGLARIFPELDAAKLKRRFAPPAKFVWVQRRLSPEQAQQVLGNGNQNGHQKQHQSGTKKFTKGQRNSCRDQVLCLLRRFCQQWHQPDNRGRCGKENGPKPPDTGVIQGFGHSPAIFAGLIVAGDHDQAVIHHDSGQRQHAEKRKQRQRHSHDQVHIFKVSPRLFAP